MRQSREELVLAPIGIAERRVAFSQSRIQAQLFHRQPGALSDDVDKRDLAFAPLVCLIESHRQGRYQTAIAQKRSNDQAPAALVLISFGVALRTLVTLRVGEDDDLSRACRRKQFRAAGSNGISPDERM